MAAEWPVLSLREAGVSLIDCEHKTPPSAENGYPYVAIPQIKAGRIDVTNARRITLEHFVAWTRKANPAPYDVVLSRRCNPGETAFVPPGLECALGQNLVLLRTDGTKVLAQFLRWLVRGPQWWEQVGKFINVGAVFDSLKCADIPEFRLPIPPLDEQRAVAHILETLDDKMELSRQTNQTLEEIARAIFKSWFVDFDPVRAKAEGRQPYGMDAETAERFPSAFEESSAGLIPSGWRRGSIAEIARYVNGRNFTKDATGFGRMVIRIAELNSGLGASTVFNQVDAEPVNIAQPDDVLFAWSGSLGVYRWHRDEALINQHIFKVVCDQFPQWFAFYQLQESMDYFREIASHKATTMGHIKRGHLSEVAIALPPEELLTEASRTIDPIYREIHVLERESQILAALRDTLLPKLISGEVRIRDAEQMAEAAL